MPEDAPVMSAVSATSETLIAYAGRQRRRGCEDRSDVNADGDIGGPGPRLGGRVPLGPGGAVISRPPTRAGGRQPGADTVPAGPRPDRALEGVPAAEAQDAGLRGAGGGPLPDQAHPHAGGLLHLSHG